MGRSQNFRTGSPANIVLQDQLPSIEVGLRTNPNVIAYLAGSIETALNHYLRSDENTVAKLHRLRMLQDHAHSHLEIVSRSAAHRAQEHPAHECIERALPHPEASEEREHLLRRVRLPQPSSEIMFPCRILAHGAPAECSSYLANGRLATVTDLGNGHEGNSRNNQPQAWLVWGKWGGIFCNSLNTSRDGAYAKRSSPRIGSSRWFRSRPRA